MSRLDEREVAAPGLSRRRFLLGAAAVLTLGLVTDATTA